MGELDRIQRRLRRLRRIEAGYRSEIKRALQASKRDTVDRVRARLKFEKSRGRSERRIERLSPKIRALTARLEQLKGRSGKG